LAKTIGKKQKAKTKGMAMGHAFFLFLFPLLPISIPPSAFSLQPIPNQFRLNRSRLRLRNP